MHASVRRYRDLSAGLLAREIERQFAPRLRKLPGFVAYYVILEGETGLTTVSVFSTEEMAKESDVVAAAWLKERSETAPVSPTDVSAGRLVLALPPIRG